MSQAILGIVREYTHATLSPEARFDELGIDSLEFVQIITDVESALHIRIPNEVLPKIRTVRDLLEEALRHSS